MEYFSNITMPLVLSLIAGLATALGSVTVLIGKPNKKFFSIALGFSAGIMVYVSFVELFDSAKTSLTALLGLKTATIYTTVAFFIGILFVGLLDFFIPEDENPHEVQDERKLADQKKNHALKRVGITTALVIAIHNFPEGFATFMSGTTDLSVALSVTFAVAIHNIPEGMAVALPIFYATNNRKLAFSLSALSGLSEPIGGLLGYLIFGSMANDLVLGIIFAIVAGIMVYISIDELLPTAEAYGNHHLSVWGFIIGMVFMSISLILFLN